ncbi:MAG: signal peptide peptidase SppA [Zetaproteobacteria bacterium]|nr:MAG: signal peptide peptidase SppA [Zetaproteobacteria bacterium]
MKSTWRKWLDRLDVCRRIVLNILFVMLILLVLAVWMSRDIARLPDEAILVVHPQGTLVETVALPNVRSPMQWLQPTEQVPVHDLVRWIRDAADDPRIKALQLELDELNEAPLARLDLLRRAIVHFRKAGKPVIATGNRFSQGQYFVASAANLIILHPLGFVDIRGFGVYRSYFKQALDRLHIDVHVMQAGTYKSAIEPFTRDDMSPAARETNRRWLEQSWQFYKETVRAARGIKAGLLQELADHPHRLLTETKGNAASLAVHLGLVDALGGKDELDKQLAGLLDLHAQHLPQTVDISRYAALHHSRRPASDKPKIGILVAQGMILEGEQPPGTIGSTNLVRQLESLADDSRYQAIVLRLDSPGGSALASETIRQALLKLRRKKPLIVSMGSVAASGGYWLATAAQAVVAERTTLTGSIGVFGLIAKADRALDMLGVHNDGLGTGRMTGALMPGRPLPDELKQALQLGVDHVYERFLNVVSEGRSLDKEKVRLAAEGRVWLAPDALRLGLIDKLGSVEDAVAIAAQKAGLTNYETIWIQPARNWRDQLVAELFEGLLAPVNGSRLSIPDPALVSLQPWLNLLGPVQQGKQIVLALWPVQP